MTSVLPAAPVTPKAAATRKRLLELSARLFIERGYDAVSLRDIAGEAGLTKGAIYGHFRSKGQLLVEVIRIQLDERDAQFDPEANATDPGAAFDLFIDPGSRELRLLQIDAAAAARHDPDVAAGTEEVNALREAWILSTLQDIENAETVAFVISALSAGVGVQEAHARQVPDTEEWRRTLRKMFNAAFRETRR
jgi:AcrR family transcriptional regulator